MNRRKGAGKTSQFKGVYRKDGKWAAQIVDNKKKKYLGTFGSEQEAARVYNVAAKDRFGEFAVLNDV
jgi:hypothetical protein